MLLLTKLEFSSQIKFNMNIHWYEIDKLRNNEWQVAHMNDK